MHFVLLPAFNPGPYTGAGNNTYLIPGREPTLIDAGAGDPRHLDALAGALAGAPLARVLVTHAHSDHASGAPAIAARWPGAAFAKMPWPARDDRYPVPWQPLSDGDRVPAGDGELTVVHTPGHAPDHLCFFDEGGRTLFAADLVVAGGTVVIPATSGGRLADYLASLRRILALEPVRLLPAHGPAIDDPARTIREYLEHRQRREEQVLAALAAGGDTPERIVERVYEQLAADLIGAARESVLAHLVKLEDEGRVAREGGRWRLAGVA